MNYSLSPLDFFKLVNGMTPEEYLNEYSEANEDYSFSDDDFGDNDFGDDDFGDEDAPPSAASAA